MSGAGTGMKITNLMHKSIQKVVNIAGTAFCAAAAGTMITGAVVPLAAASMTRVRASASSATALSSSEVEPFPVLS